MNLLEETIDKLNLFINVKEAISGSRNSAGEFELDRAIDKVAKEAENLIKGLKSVRGVDKRYLI